MKCGVCGTRLQRVGYKPKKYYDSRGYHYKTIHWPRYAPCAGLSDPERHPARFKGSIDSLEKKRGAR